MPEQAAVLPTPPLVTQDQADAVATVMQSQQVQDLLYVGYRFSWEMRPDGDVILILER